MKRLILFVAVGAAIAFLSYSPGQNQAVRPGGAAPAARLAIRIAFGEKQERETDYSGTISLTQGRVTELIPWRFYGSDAIDGQTGWRVVTTRANLENQPDRPRPLATAGADQNIVMKAVSAVLDAPGTANVTVETRRGTYRFGLDALAG